VLNAGTSARAALVVVAEFGQSDCSKGPSLIADDAGDPTQTYGAAFERHLKSVQP